MTVAEMIAQRTTSLEGILNNSNVSVAYKGGTPASDLFGIPDAITSIPTGAALPELTTPAEVGHVLAGKEYIDGNGKKKAGTLVVCDTIEEVEFFGIAGTGVSLDIQSTADGSGKTMTLRETNLLPENIVAGSSIFGVPGTAKTMRVETGTITPAEDTTTISIPCSANPKYAVLLTTSDATAEGDITGAIIYNILYAGKFPGNCVAGYYYSGRIRSSALAATVDAGISIPEISSVCFYRAGTAYQWTAYYWEDDA